MELGGMIEQQIVISNLITWVFYLIIPAFIGSSVSDYLKTVNHTALKVSVVRILFATAASCIITYALMTMSLLAERKSIIPVVSLFIGLLGFEILQGFSSIENMAKFAHKLSKVLLPIVNIAKQVSEIRKALSVAQKDKESDDDDKTQKS